MPHEVEQSPETEVRSLHYRQATIERAMDGEEGEGRRLEVAFSSETPVRVYDWESGRFADEVLSHKRGDYDMSRLNDGAPFLDSHRAWDPEAVIGAVVRGSVKVKERVARAEIVMDDPAENERAGRVLRQLDRLDLRGISVGYSVERYERVRAADRKDGENERDLLIAREWSPFEISAVTMPADRTVGIGRGADGEVQVTPMPHLNGQRNTALEASQPPQGGANERSAAMPPENETQETEVRQEAAPKVEVRTLGEGSDAGQLIAIGEQYEATGGREMAREAIKNGTSPADFAAQCATKMREAYAKTQATAEQRAEDAKIGMSNREVNGFSFVRLFNALAQPNDPEAQERGAAELEASRAACQAAAARGEQVNGSYRLPADVMYGDFVPNRTSRRAMDHLTRALRALGTTDSPLAGGAATADTGADLVERVLAADRYIDFLYDESVILPRVTMLTDLVGNVDVPRMDTAPAPVWGSEGQTNAQRSGALQPKDAPKFDKVSLTMKRLQVSTEITRELLRQSTPDVEMLVRSSFGIQMRNALEVAIIAGTGANAQPSGILTHSTGAGFDEVHLRADDSPGTNGNAVSWDMVVGLESEVAQRNANLGMPAYLCNARLNGKFKTTPKAGTYPVFLNNGDGMVNGYPVLVTNHSALNAANKGSGRNLAHLIYGNFADVLLGMWGGTDFQANPYSRDTEAIVRIVAWQFADVTLRHGEGFGRATSLITA